MNLKSKVYVQDYSLRGIELHIQEPALVVTFIKVKACLSQGLLKVWLHLHKDLLVRQGIFIMTSMTVAGNTELVQTQAHFVFPHQGVLGVPLPDNFVHGRVGEERLIELIVAPLPVAQQVYYHIPAELALVLDSQSCGTDHFFRIIPIHMDNCTSNNFTCPEVQNIAAVIIPKLFQRI